MDAWRLNIASVEFPRPDQTDCLLHNNRDRQTEISNLSLQNCDKKILRLKDIFEPLISMTTRASFIKSLPWFFARNLLTDIMISFYRNIVCQNVSCEFGLTRTTKALVSTIDVVKSVDLFCRKKCLLSLRGILLHYRLIMIIREPI